VTTFTTEQMKKRSEATQTLRAGCSKADTQTNKHTDKGDYNALRCLARSVRKHELLLMQRQRHFKTLSLRTTTNKAWNKSSPQSQCSFSW